MMDEEESIKQTSKEELNDIVITEDIPPASITPKKLQYTYGILRHFYESDAVTARVNLPLIGVREFAYLLDYVAQSLDMPIITRKRRIGGRWTTYLIRTDGGHLIKGGD